MVTPRHDPPIDTPQPGPGCTSHKALCSDIIGLADDVKEERRQRERDTDALKASLENVRADVVKVKVDLSKLMAGVGVVLAVLQLLLKYLPNAAP